MKTKDPFISAERCTDELINSELRSLRAKLLIRGGRQDELLSELIDCVIINLNLYLKEDKAYKKNVMYAYNTLSNINFLLEINYHDASEVIHKALQDHYDEMCYVQVLPERTALSLFSDFISWVQSSLRSSGSITIQSASVGDSFEPVGKLSNSDDDSDPGHA